MQLDRRVCVLFTMDRLCVEEEKWRRYIENGAELKLKQIYLLSTGIGIFLFPSWGLLQLYKV